VVDGQEPQGCLEVDEYEFRELMMSDFTRGLRSKNSLDVGGWKHSCLPSSLHFIQNGPKSSE
jgi:hypothetical protein